MALVFKAPATELPLEGVKVVCKYKKEVADSVELVDEFKLEKCHNNDSPFFYTYNFYFVKKKSGEAGVPVAKVTGWTPFVEDWREQLEAGDGGSGDD